MPPDDQSLELFPSRPAPRSDPGAPLADRVRPRNLDEVVGQDALLGKGRALRSLLETGELPSVILWGPPGSGKTTVARLLADSPDVRFEALSAVIAGVKEIRSVAERSERERRAGHRTVLFLDEIHRLNRAQQDVLLPHVEAGTFTLIGATTENPSFEVNAPLLSRCRVFTLKPLSSEALAIVVRRAASDRERGLGDSGVELGDDAVAAIVEAADGDARRALGILEAAVAIQRRREEPGPLTLDAVQESAGHRVLVHDRDREEHYNVASAFIKSLRASDPDASLYYLSRLLAAGDDPLFAARRLVIFASEDVGNADPAALSLATSTYLVVERIGMPEGRIPLAQATTYLACAPKSNASYKAIGRALEAIERTGSAPVPMHLRNAPTGLMKGLGYGAGYRSPHDEPDGLVEMDNLPEVLSGERFYEPKEIGAEVDIAERLRSMRGKRKAPGE